MGVVYRAKQLSVNRPVAVKMLRNGALAGDDQLKRFQAEAEAVALLDHPGIVPIYEVGNDRGERYFSMKLVEGTNLEARLPALSADFRAAARLVAEVADAVNHAHQRGILHRDLKPANILIDSAGAPHVTDFGLARKIQGDAGITVSGAIMGTPAYMSPEQAMGRTREVTIASDVYGLGGVLYAALTGSAPFGGDSVLETLEQVRHAPPEAPTRRNPGVPIDLEVICLKCLQKDPKRRYATAGELADDLRRFLAGEPIEARPVGTLVRAWMWCRRKPAIAAMSGALAAALLVGAVTVTYQWRVALHLRTLADAARDRAQASEASAVASEKAAQAARAQAEQNAQTAGIQATLALNTIQDLIVQVRENLNTPNLYTFKTSLLDSALRRINTVADVYDKSTSREATTLAALFELGKIYRQLGQTEKAFRQFEKCLAVAKQRIVIKEGSDSSRQNLANSYLELALSAEEYRRDMKASLGYNRESLKTWQDVADHPKPAGFPIDPKVIRYWLAESHQRVGIGLYRLGELTAARDEYRQAHNIRAALVEAYPDVPSFRQDLSYSQMALAETAFRLGDPASADALYAKVLEQREANARAKPDAPLGRAELAAVRYMIGEFKLKSGDLASAREHLRSSRTIREALVDADPKNVVNRRDLGITLYRLGNLDEIEKKPEAARETFAGLVTLRRDLAQVSETNDRRRMELVLAMAHTDRYAEAAATTADTVAAGPAEVVDRETRFDLARAYALCGRAARAEQAEAYFVKAVAMLGASIADGYRDTHSLQTEPDLEPLRGRDDFRRLLAR